MSESSSTTPSPRPWRVNKKWRGRGFECDPKPAIVDANGETVLSSSEWMHLTDANADLIVRAVNALPTGASDARP